MTVNGYIIDSGDNLSNADLSGANLTGVKLTLTQLNELTHGGQITPDQASQCKMIEIKVN